MSDVCFIADTHFGHRGIIGFEATKSARPFATIEQHDAELMRWNSVVRPSDIVRHLGDFCFGKANLEIAAAVTINVSSGCVPGDAGARFEGHGRPREPSVDQ